MLHRVACLLLLLALAPGCDSGSDPGGGGGGGGDVQNATVRATIIPAAGASGALYDGNYAFADRNGIQSTGEIVPRADGSWTAESQAIGITMGVEVDADAAGPVRVIVTVDGSEARSVTVNQGEDKIVQYFID